MPMQRMCSGWEACGTGCPKTGKVTVIPLDNICISLLYSVLFNVCGRAAPVSSGGESWYSVSGC